jgi:hypothetical protein
MKRFIHYMKCSWKCFEHSSCVDLGQLGRLSVWRCVVLDCFTILALETTSAQDFSHIIVPVGKGELCMNASMM